MAASIAVLLLMLTLGILSAIQNNCPSVELGCRCHKNTAGKLELDCTESGPWPPFNQLGKITKFDKIEISNKQQKERLLKSDLINILAREIRLHSNDIDLLENKPFAATKDELKVLAITSNLIQTIDVGGLRNLTHLFLDNNRLTGIPANIHECNQLQELSLTRNDITGSETSIPNNLTTSLPNLRFLWLNNNRIKTISLDMRDFRFQSPIVLGLQGNQFTCDCGLLWLKDFSNTWINLDHKKEGKPTCQMPRDVKGYAIDCFYAGSHCHDYKYTECVKPTPKPRRTKKPPRRYRRPTKYPRRYNRITTLSISSTTHQKQSGESSIPSSMLTPILASSIGMLVILLIIAICIIYRRRRRNKKTLKRPKLPSIPEDCNSAHIYMSLEDVRYLPMGGEIGHEKPDSNCPEKHYAVTDLNIDHDYYLEPMSVRNTLTKQGIRDEEILALKHTSALYDSDEIDEVNL